MKNWYLTRLRVQGDELWTTSPDVLAISTAQAAEEALREKAIGLCVRCGSAGGDGGDIAFLIDRGDLWLDVGVEVEAALDTQANPLWERFLLKAKRTISITTV
jgi:hypothetical protein